MASGKVRWGVLGVASIAVRKVIPAMQRCQYAEITAIASRDGAKAARAAAELGIPKSYGSYEALLADPDVDAVYNPLPNHLHVPWSIRALEAGKHVLCEKPLGLSTVEVRAFLAARDRTGLRAGEAFMVRTHPQWLRAHEVVRAPEFGGLRAVVGWFAYNNPDPADVRNVAEYGGGGLMDIGCYPIFVSRYLFGEEPVRAAGTLEFDPVFHTDRLASAVLEYPSGQAILTCSTQLVYGQRILAFGTEGKLEIEIPFNAPPDAPARIWVNAKEELLPVADQYTIQGDLFSQAIRGEAGVAVPLEDSFANMAVIEALVRSSKSGTWERPEKL